MAKHDDDNEANRNLAQQIASLDQKLKNSNGVGRRLEFYRLVGEHIGNLGGKHGVYGKKHMKNLAEDLAELNISGMGPNNLYKMERFAAAIDASDIETLDAKGVSWRSAVGLATDNLTKVQRKVLIRRLVNGEFSPKDLGKEILAMIPSKARSGTRSVEKAYDRAGKAIRLLKKAATLPNNLANDKLEALRKLLG